MITPQGTSPYAVYYVPLSHLKSQELVPSLTGEAKNNKINEKKLTDEFGGLTLTDHQKNLLAETYLNTKNATSWYDSDYPAHNLNFVDGVGYDKSNLPPLKKSSLMSSRKKQSSTMLGLASEKRLGGSIVGSSSSRFVAAGRAKTDLSHTFGAERGKISSFTEPRQPGGLFNNEKSKNLFNNKKRDLRVQIAAGLIAELSISEESYVAAVIDQIFSQNPEQFSGEKMDEYCLCLNGVAISPMKRLSTLDLEGDSKLLTLEKKSTNLKKKVFADPSEVPKLTKPGYETEPSYAEISRMTKTELQNIQNFTVKNQNGKVVFLDKTDVTGLNLDDIVDIKPKSVALYEGVTPKGPVGTGLNKEAQITYFNFGIDRSADFEKLERKVKKWTKKLGVHFIALNPAMDTLSISVDKF